jgi:GT2 family glycosyltransferase
MKPGASIGGISVAISTLDRPESLGRCLDALLAGQALPAEIVVVDQATDSRAEEVLSVRRSPGGPDLVYLRQPKRGLGASQNLAVTTARQPIVAVTDDDCIPDPNWLAVIEKVFKASHAPETPDVLTGRVLPLPPEGDRTEPVSSRVSTERRDFRGRALPWEVGSGNNFALRREWFDRIGGCDERLGPGAPVRGGVDMDLFYRLLRAGARARYEPDSLVFHERQTRADRLARRPMYGRGMGACCALWLRQGDPYALRVLASWLALRTGRIGRDLLKGYGKGIYEEALVLEGTVRGMGQGLFIR